MAKLRALNVINWGKFSISLPQVCARSLYLDHHTNTKRLKIKIQPFCTQINKVISSSPLINYRLFPINRLKLSVMPAKILVLRKCISTLQQNQEPNYIFENRSCHGISCSTDAPGRKVQMKQRSCTRWDECSRSVLVVKEQRAHGEVSLSPSSLPHSHLDCSKYWYTGYIQIYKLCLHTTWKQDACLPCPTV